MTYDIVLPAPMQRALSCHLSRDRSREQMAIVLAGIHRNGDHLRLLGRHLIEVPPEGFARQSAGGLELAPSLQRHVLERCASEGLSQIDWHTHPGDGPGVGFSGIDDQSERALAAYLGERLPSTLYASVVMNSTAMAARVWRAIDGVVVAVPIAPPTLDEHDFRRVRPDGAPLDRRYDRQVRAFGREFQTRLGALSVGVVGVGGLGSVLVEELARLGVRRFVLVDPDVVETTNLNRLIGATPVDAREEIPKVDLAAENVRRLDPSAEVLPIRTSVYTTRALTALTTCDLLVVATDDDASRLTINALSAQYLIPLVHLGVNLTRGDNQELEDVSGEVAAPVLGSWCLLCAGLIDPQRASWDLARPEEQALLAGHGYLPGTPAPSVYHLNALTASLAVTEIHNLICRYKPARRYLVYRELVTELMAVEVEAAESCLHCGADGRRGLGDLVPLWRPEACEVVLPAALPPALVRPRGHADVEIVL